MACNKQYPTDGHLLVIFIYCYYLFKCSFVFEFITKMSQKQALILVWAVYLCTLGRLTHEQKTAFPLKIKIELDFHEKKKCQKKLATLFNPIPVIPLTWRLCRRIRISGDDYTFHHQPPPRPTPPPTLTTYIWIS